MFQPAHVDGRTLVIIRRRPSLFNSGFTEVMRGRLEHDGAKLTLVGNCGRRVISDAELATFMPVNEGNRIPECAGFDFFLIQESDG